MSHFRRRLMMQRKASILPAGYTQLEYIERDADNQGYIDTGIKMKPSYSMLLDFNPLSKSLMGRTPSFWGGRYFYFYTSSRSYLLYPFRDSLPVSFSLESMPLGTWQRAILDNNYITMGGRTYEVSDMNDTHNFILLSDESLEESNSQTSYFKVSDGDIVLVELIPARRNSDSAVGMFDLVSNNFLTSPSGTIKAGPKV